MPLNFLWSQTTNKYVLSWGFLHFDFNFCWAFVESLDVHVKVDNALMAQVTLGTVLQVESILVPLHVPLPGEHFVTNVTGELPPLAFMYLWYVHSKVLLISEIFIAHSTHKLFGGRVRCRLVLLCAWQGWQQQFGNLQRRAFGQDGGGTPLRGLADAVERLLLGHRVDGVGHQQFGGNSGGGGGVVVADAAVANAGVLGD